MNSTETHTEPGAIIAEIAQFATSHPNLKVIPDYMNSELEDGTPAIYPALRIIQVAGKWAPTLNERGGPNGHLDDDKYIFISERGLEWFANGVGAHFDELKRNPRATGEECLRSLFDERQLDTNPGTPFGPHQPIIDAIKLYVDRHFPLDYDFKPFRIQSADGKPRTLGAIRIFNQTKDKEDDFEHLYIYQDDGALQQFCCGVGNTLTDITPLNAGDTILRFFDDIQ